MVQENWYVRRECIRLGSLARPAARPWQHLVPINAPPPKGRYYRDSTSPIVDPFPFPSRYGGYRHPVNRFALSLCRMAHLRSRFPMDNNMTFNGGAGKTPTGDTRCYIAAAVSRVIALCMCEGTVRRALQQVHRKFGEFAAYRRAAFGGCRFVTKTVILVIN